MSRAIDHLVLATRDLDAAADFYGRIGFTVGPRNVHPFGTENRIVQLGNSYLELIGLSAGPRLSGTAIPESFIFRDFIESWLEQREGLAMLALRTADAETDALAFHAAGIGDSWPLRFERGGKAADGSEVRLGFTLAFARSPLIQAAGFFTCQHRSPQLFWNKALQNHANSAEQLAGVIMLAENPSAHAEFLGECLGQREMLATSMGVEMASGDRQKLEVLTVPAAEFRLGRAAAGNDSATRFIAYRVKVNDPDETRRTLRDAGVGFEQRGSMIIVPPGEAFGAAIVFEPRLSCEPRLS